MEIMSPIMMIENQVKDVGNLMRQQVHPIDAIIKNTFSPDELKEIRQIYITGDGDSFHAALSSEMVFRSLTSISCNAISAMPFLEYYADYISTIKPNDTLVIGVSASGGTQRVFQAIERVKTARKDIITLAVSGNLNGIVSQAADKKIPVKLPDKGMSPGIRTYQASLIALMLLAIQFSEVREQSTEEEAIFLREELVRLGDGIDATVEISNELAKTVAKVIKTSPYLLFLGSGPSYGTSVFSAAKIIESAGVFSMGQDLEEWAHVENLAYPDETPTFLIAPPGKGYWRAVDLAKTAKEKGRLLIAVIQEDDQVIRNYADFIFPIKTDIREEFSPLIYHIPADLVAAYLTIELNRNLFQLNRPEVRQRWAAMIASREKNNPN